MGRPVKPVMWTDEEERINRIVEYSKQNTTVRLGMSSDDSIWWGVVETFAKWASLTIESLLHDLNIIKPIGRLEYTSEWIDKILSGQKTMDIIPTQHACGYYELWDTDRQEVRGIVEVTDIERLEMESYLGFYGYLLMDKNYIDGDCLGAKRSGFDSAESFIAYHRTHFQSVKYAITYQVVDMKGDVK